MPLYRNVTTFTKIRFLGSLKSGYSLILPLRQTKLKPALLFCNRGETNRSLDLFLHEALLECVGSAADKGSPNQASHWVVLCFQPASRSGTDKVAGTTRNSYVSGKQEEVEHVYKTQTLFIRSRFLTHLSINWHLGECFSAFTASIYPKVYLQSAEF